MSTKQPTVNKISTPKKTLLAEVALQISKAVPTLKALLGEKKFEKRIKKASKLLIDGLKATEPTKAAITKTAPTPTPVAKKAAPPKKKSVKAVPVKKS